MSDADLEQIRAARLQQLKAQPGAGGGSGAASSVSSNSSQNSDSATAQRAAILAQILEPAAEDRLNRIRLVKASRAEDVEDRLIVMAQRGMLRAKVSEVQLKDLLAQLSEKEEETGAGVGKIVTSRRKGWEDEDDDLFDGLDN